MWTWLSPEPNGVLAALAALQPDATEAEKTPTPLPLAVRWVLLVMELALVSGGAFLLLLSSFVIGALVRGLLGAGVVVQLCEAAAFGWGLVTCMSWFFHVPKRDFVRRLAAFGWPEGRTCMVSVLLHSVATVALTTWRLPSEDQVVWSWENARAAVHRPDGSLATAMTRNLLLAPMAEELFFRGALVLVTVNRLKSVEWGASVSSVLFAAIHLANARHLGTQYSASYLVFQVMWALLVGLFLALELVVSGSLVECFALHTINNIFALGVARNAAMDLTQPGVCVSILISFSAYALAIAKQLQALRHKASRDKTL